MVSVKNCNRFRVKSTQILISRNFFKKKLFLKRQNLLNY